MSRNKPITGDLMPDRDGVHNLGGPNNYFGKAYIRELVGGAIATGGGGANKPYSTVVVAPSDSKAVDRQNADFVMDGVDDEDTIQAAIDSITSGEILILDGTINWGTNSIVPKSNIKIRGMGRRVTRIVSSVSGDTSTLIWLFDTTGTVDNFEICDLSLDGNGSRRGFLEISTASANGLILDNIEYYNASGNTARLLGLFNGTWRNIWVTNCYMHDTSVSNSVLIYGSSTTTAVENIVIVGNEFDEAIYVSSANSSVDAKRCIIGNNIMNNDGIILEDISHSIIANNTIFRNGGSGITVGPFTRSCQFNVISGNILQFSNDNYSAYGILLDYGGDTGLSCSNNVVDGNTVLGGSPNYYPDYAIYIGSHFDGVTPTYNVITNNTTKYTGWSVFNEASGTIIDGNEFTFSNFVTESNGNDCTFNNNICVDSQVTSWYGQRISIVGNKFMDMQFEGLQFNGQNSLIAENYFYNNNSNGASFSGIDAAHLLLHDYPIGGQADDNIVIDNIFRNGANTSQRCVVIETADCDRNIIANNDFRNGFTAAGPIQDNGTGTVIGTNWS